MRSKGTQLTNRIESSFKVNNEREINPSHKAHIAQILGKSTDINLERVNILRIMCMCVSWFSSRIYYLRRGVICNLIIKIKVGERLLFSDLQETEKIIVLYIYTYIYILFYSRLPTFISMLFPNLGFPPILHIIYTYYISL